MSWPTMSDYQEAVQNPANCFSDAQLKLGTPTLNALGLPTPVTGGFCSVYQVTSAKTRWAVRCFLHNIRDGRERYKEISKYLRSRKLKEMVGFEYVPEGIRIHGQWHPVLKMEWVDGLQLNTWVDRNSQDPKALRQLDDRWAQLMDSLEAAGIGHCDLQHGNVLVDGSGHLRLIDYDGMYVPALRGKGSHEKGHPAYQHPQRDGRDFDETVDRFAALVVHTSLLAVAESPALWKRFYDDDNLIFKRADFQDPDNSTVFGELAKLKGVVAARAAVLRDACKKRLTETPRLRDVRGGQKAAAQAKKPARIFQFPFGARKPAETHAQAPMQKVAGGGTISAGPAPRASAGHAHAPRAAAAPAAAPNHAPAPRPAIFQLPRRSAPPSPAARPAGPGLRPGAPPAPAKHQKDAAHKPPAPVPIGGPGLGPGAPPAARPASQPAWMNSASTPRASAPGPGLHPGPHVSPAPRPTPPGAQPARTQSQPASRAVTPTASARPASGRVTSAAANWTGWGIEWMRPGEIRERHIWQVPVIGKRQVPRTLFGFNLGMRTERFAESYEEKVEELGYRLGGHRLEITSLAFTLDARLLVSSSRDGSVRVWNVKRGRESCAPLEAESPVLATALVPGHTMVALILEEKTLVLWDHGHKRKLIHLEAPDRSDFKALAVSNDGQWVAAGGSGRRIHVWNTERGVAAGEFQRSTGRIRALAFTPDASGVVCATHKSRLELFDRATGEPRWSVRTTCRRVGSLFTSRHTSGLLGAAADGTVARWDWTDGSEQQRMRPTPERLRSFASTPDAATLLVGLGSGKASVHETAANREVGLLDGHPGAVTAVALTATGKCAATGSTDGSIRLWSLR